MLNLCNDMEDMGEVYMGDKSLWANHLIMTGLFLNRITEVKSQKRWIVELLEDEEMFFIF